jgi:sugar O-acyltransferase (sialic acid O-acetyltransferase NeuD family)
MFACAIIGAGGHARTVVAIAQAALGGAADSVAVLDVRFDATERLLGATLVAGPIRRSIDSVEARSFVVAIGDNRQRAEWFAVLADLGRPIASLVHPSALIGPEVTIGRGTVVAAGAILGPCARIGEDCIVNHGAIIDHESVVGDHSHVAPGVRIAGRVTIGRFSMIGIGASVKDQLHIGEAVIVGAGSVVVDDVPDGATVIGVPARAVPGAQVPKRATRQRGGRS